MRQLGAYTVKTRFAELLDAVAHGETIIITRHGKPVAQLVPVDRPRWTPDDLAARFRRLRAAVGPGQPSIRELIDEGRRF
jgi:prevent-host-death family protein